MLTKMSGLLKDAIAKDLEEKVIKAFSTLIRELKKNFTDSIASKKGELSRELHDALFEIKDIELSLKTLVTNSEQNSLRKNQELSQTLTREIERVLKLIATLPDLPILEKKIEEVEEKILPEETPEEIREKLESLKEEDRLPKEAVKGIEDIEDDIKRIEEEIEKLKRNKGGGTVYVSGSSGGGRIVKSYDIFSQLNGVLKTFTLPAFYRIISVHASSFPWTFRETVDYTTDPSAMTITFTSEITAGSTLATGQTVTVVYSEA